MKLGNAKSAVIVTVFSWPDVKWDMNLNIWSTALEKAVFQMQWCLQSLVIIVCLVVLNVK